MEKIELRYLEQLLLDDSFRDFVTGNDPAIFKKWEDWLTQHPDSKREFDLAVEVTRFLAGAKHPEISLDSEASLKSLLTRFEIEKREKESRPKSIRLSALLRWAAVFLLIAGLSAVFFFYFGSTLKTGDQKAFNEIIVPIGEKAQVVLADGSHVWINSGSKLKYPVKYNTQSREVSLQGEAYFDVAKNGKLPFIVSTEKANIRVLGTAFNVKFYPGDANVETTVVRGLVRVEDKTDKNNYVFIKPREKCLVNSKSNEVQNQSSTNVGKPEISNVPEFKIFTHVNTELVTSWKDQLLVFSDERFDELAVKMERWYNIKIVIEDESLKSMRFRGKFVNNETIYQVLDAIKVIARMKYHVSNNKIYISKK